MFYGRGAGDLPTGSAVVSDIVSILRSNIDIDNLNPVVKNNLWKKEFNDINEINSKYYIRLTVEDRPGVLGEITSVFGGMNVSLKSVIQKGPDSVEENKITLVLVTHDSKEGNVSNALNSVCNLNSVYKIDNLIRIEDFN